MTELALSGGMWFWLLVVGCAALAWVLDWLQDRSERLEGTITPEGGSDGSESLSDAEEDLIRQGYWHI